MAKRITATQLARSLKRVLDGVEHRGEEVVIIRNNQLIARIVPGVQQMTALEALSDLYQTLPNDAGKDWVKDARKLRGRYSDFLRNPWDT